MKILKNILNLAVLIVAVAANGATVSLTSGTGEVTLQNNDVLTGTGGPETHVTIAVGATVTLRGVHITAIPHDFGDVSHMWAGITCEGDATIVLEGANVVRGGHEDYPGIFVPVGSTVTIKGKGALDVSSNGNGAGIGGGNYLNCGGISLAGGTITATGGSMAAGIGGGAWAECGDINIGGFTVVTATGGMYAPGIGGGALGFGGSVVITESARCVTAISGGDAPYSIGAGAEGECGTVTIAGVAQAEDVAASPYIYNPCITNITSAADWNAFASRVNRGIDAYEDLTVTLAADINVTNMVGIVSNPFSGTFEGGGHSLDVNISAGTATGATFGSISGATIRNLNVSGSVTGGRHSAGLVGTCSGSGVLNSISNCTVSVAVAVSDYAGGIVGHGGNGNQLSITDCVFSGTIFGFANHAGGILGWGDRMTLSISNCLFKGSFLPASAGTYHPVACKLGGSYIVTATVSSVYYLHTIQPTAPSGNVVAAGEPVSATYVPLEWTEEVTAADGLTYYAQPPIVTLADETALVTLQDGDVLTGTGGANTHIVIAAGATVMLRDVVVTSIGNDNNHQWAGVTCLGDAVIILKGMNRVEGGNGSYPGIQVPQGSTLAFQGDGRLDTRSKGSAVAIDGSVTIDDGLIDVVDGDTRRILYGIDIAETESNAAAIASHAGHTGIVRMAGRTLYTDGRYNTLCLPFSMSAAEIAASPLAGATIKKLDNATSRLAGGTLSLDFTDVTEIEAGRPYVVQWPIAITIRSAADWNAFAARVRNGETFANTTVKLGADISVTTMAGATTLDEVAVDRPFCGTFDGAGHVLTVNYANNTGAPVAPFPLVAGGTIKNLVVAGSITGSAIRAGGLVGEFGADGNSYVKNCRVCATISGGSYTGGFSVGGHAYYTNCLFDGKITGTNASGGFLGWGEPDTRIRNCLFAPQDGSSIIGGTFYNTGSVTASSAGMVIDNSYYTTAVGGTQGASASGMTAEQLCAALGEGWELVGGSVRPSMPRTDVILSSADWDAFAAAVESGYFYEGRTVRLAADISVTTMVGDVDAGKSFRGTFDGGGHTLTFNYETNQIYCAPFLSVEQATFENLKVAGTIKTSAKFAAGLISASWGDCTIRNCQVGIEINSQVQGDGTHGGFIAISGEGAGGNQIRFENCLFNGRFRGASTTLCGGFVGWNRVNVSYTSCLFDPAVQQFASGATFNRNNAGSFTRAYYKTVLGAAQGINASQMTAEQLLGALGDGWTLHEEGGQSHVVPKMYTSSGSDGSTIDGLLFDGVNVSDESASVKIDLAEQVLVIRSAADWNTFADNVASGAESYDGWTVKLADDISVSKMVGASGKPFKGIFNGLGHTITVNLQAGGQGIAPFYEINGATIQNLRVTGSVTSTRLRPASFAAFVSAGNRCSTIKNCWSDATIVASYGDWIDAGGFVARVDNSATLIVNDCAFHGSIEYTSANGYEGGGMIGWVNGHVELNNCLFAPRSIIRAKTDGNSYYFAAAYNRDNYTLSNCYYSGAAGSSPLKSEGIQGNALSAPALVNSLGSAAWRTCQEGEATYVVPQMESAAVAVAEFVGVTSPVTLGTGGYRSALIIADDGKLAVPETGATVNSCRAFFLLKGLPAGSVATRYVLNLGSTTSTGPLDMPTASGYALWAADNGISGAADETDANGVANVFRYAFDKPAGAFADPALLAIAFEAGQVVIYTPPLVNTEGYTFSIVAADALGGNDTATYPAAPSGRTVIPAANKPARFFRLRAVETE